jgi:integrase
MGKTAYRFPFPHPKVVSDILGHSSITMTLDRYSHWIPSMGRHAAEGMDEALG